MEQGKIDRLRWILDDAVARGEIPGAILMVRKEGKETVYLESGYADIETKKPLCLRFFVQHNGFFIFLSMLFIYFW